MPVAAFSSPPTASISSAMAWALRRAVPLKAICSRKCATPCSGRLSLRLPAPTQMPSETVSTSAPRMAHDGEAIRQVWTAATLTRRPRCEARATPPGARRDERGDDQHLARRWEHGQALVLAELRLEPFRLLGIAAGGALDGVGEFRRMRRRRARSWSRPRSLSPRRGDADGRVRIDQHAGSPHKGC